MVHYDKFGTERNSFNQNKLCYRSIFVSLQSLYEKWRNGA